ncbi:MAG: prolyl oligopeptidase family serine peptidase [Deltaproteobacteria bacterium]|nr:prolyl oligopeptidase family serine peptidase [Deltaproteobacteria bacterium]
MFFKRTLWFLAILTVTACGSRQDPPAIATPPSQAVSATFSQNIIPAVARIFSDPPLVGRTPGSTAWSPDSSAVAYIHMSSSSDGKSTSELWIHEMKGHRERPLFADDEKPVSEYEWCGPDKLVVGSGGDLLLVELTGRARKLTETTPAETGVKASPDCTKVAFVREHDVYVLDIESGAERRITEGGTWEKSFGEVTWVYGEEFGTGAGFGWSPDSSSIWLYAMNVTEVAVKNIVTDSNGNTRRQPYPRPGEANPMVRVGVINLGADSKKVTWLSTGKETDTYLPQVTWHPDSKRLVVLRLDRLQTLLELLLCNIATGECSPMLAERDPRWVNLLGEPKFLTSGKEFLWLSERDGFSHIYRFGIDGVLKGQLTSGKWVVSSIDAIDENKDEIVFTANAEEITEWGIFSTQLSDDDVEQISEDPGTHRALFSPDRKHYLDTHSALDRPPRTDIRNRSGEIEALVSRDELREYRAPEVMNDLFPIDTQGGETLMALLTRPTALDPERLYPVLVYVYGGPHVQVSRNSFRSTFQPWRNYMASRGILVFTVDGRGSGGRGREFETAIHRRLGEVELKDQLAGVAYLKTLPFVDPKRIGIFGWSYGGTMTLNALLRTKNVFNVGVSVAPVTDWQQYDTAYTERYMQRPSDNPGGYKATSLLPVADRLRVPLLLVHGLADDNVQFTNSALLVDAFVKAGKNFEVMFYPGKTHGIRGPETRADLFSRITRFIERYI